MTEQEWLEGIYAPPLPIHVQSVASKRKMRLLACAFCRHESVWRLLTDESSRKAVDASEEFADGRLDEEGLIRASRAALRFRPVGHGHNPVRLNRHGQAARAALATTHADEQNAADESQQMTMNLIGSRQCALLREIFGNPFRHHAVAPLVLAWNDGTVVRLARSIYEDRRFSDSPILADALEDAGCTDSAIIDHLHGPGPHVRGCWALDLILGRE